jgi:hypothetical protein
MDIRPISLRDLRERMGPAAREALDAALAIAGLAPGGLGMDARSAGQPFRDLPPTESRPGTE